MTSVLSGPELTECFATTNVIIGDNNKFLCCVAVTEGSETQDDENWMFLVWDIDDVAFDFFISVFKLEVTTLLSLGDPMNNGDEFAFKNCTVEGFVLLWSVDLEDL